MTLGSLIAFNIALLVAFASPGPAFLVAVRTTLVAGRSAGVAIGCGLALVAACWTLMALLGLQSVFRLFPWVYVAAKVLGGAYLIFVAFKMWRGARQPLAFAASRPNHAFLQGVLVNLLNPKTVLFAAAVLIAVFPDHMSLGHVVFVAVDHFVVEMALYVILAFCFSTRAAGAWYRGAKVYIDRLAAAVLGALGLRILTSSA